ncbi:MULTISPECIES: ParA family protein [Kocuria]|uniref:Putative chromosome partitioning protein n=1 Tax=Kocuria rhizophila (strain ATCC 9341 / DSM 348 / NBRC 103217 / DC2201) TaxID=378753 RepID=B2GK07_KOCRD|nr:MULTISPECIES: ParA family protein [Kocuria]ASE10290.1 ParA family protein [Kocuria rhizophila]MDV5999400.1 ParA family protein [Kocuria rhizophila]BAG29852.1 putative chromosome partitioning protein [Kocuria rhizophila DC2201]VEH74873.1 plasmid-partitioning protein RepA [Kocuria rhizophila]
MQIVSISSLKGGVGKSSVVLGLASAALEARIPTLVVDLDPHGDASTALGVHARQGRDVGSVLRRPRKGALGAVAVASPWAAHPITPDTSTEGPRAWAPDAARTTRVPVLDVAPGSAASSHLDHASFKPRDLKRLETALRGLDRYELVFIDCPPTLSALTRMAWAASHKVLSVAEPSLFSVAGTKRTMSALAQFEGSRVWAVPEAGVVVNKVREDSQEQQHRMGELRELFGPLVVEPVLPDLAVMQQAQGAAWPVHRWPGAPAQDLAERFTAILEGLTR